MSEFIIRRYWADSYLGPNPNDPTSTLSLPGETMMDCGFYTQYLYGFKPKWACGLRYEYRLGQQLQPEQRVRPESATTRIRSATTGTGCRRCWPGT